MRAASWTTDTYGPVHYFAHKGIQQINYHVDVRDEHASLIRDIGARAAVLLKNVNNALPLNKPKFLAVLGEDAGSNQYGPNGCPDRGCNNGTMAVGWGSGTASYPCELMAFVKDCKIEGLSDLEKKTDLVTPEMALMNQALQDRSVIQTVTNNYATNQIQAVASQADIALVFVSANSGEGYINVDGNLGKHFNSPFQFIFSIHLFQFIFSIHLFQSTFSIHPFILSRR